MQVTAILLAAIGLLAGSSGVTSACGVAQTAGTGPTAAAFIDRGATMPCYVVGDMTWPKENMEPTVHLLTQCPIHIVRDGRFLRLSSAKWTVEITIPEDPATQGFLYVWGQGVATIGTRTVSVAYGPAGGI